MAPLVGLLNRPGASPSSQAHVAGALANLARGLGTPAVPARAAAAFDASKLAVAGAAPAWQLPASTTASLPPPPPDLYASPTPYPLLRIPYSI